MAIEEQKMSEGQEPNLPRPDLRAVAENAETPLQQEVSKYVRIFQDEHGQGLSPSQLQEKLEKAGFLGVENDRLVPGERQDSDMVFEAYGEALAKRRERICEEKEKYLSVLAECKGNQKILEEALTKQGILKRKKDGELVPQKEKSFEYRGYLQALDEYKNLAETPTAPPSQKKSRHA